MPFFTLDIMNVLPNEIDLISGYCHETGYAGIEELEHTVRITVEESSPDDVYRIRTILIEKMPHLDIKINEVPIVQENWQDNWKDFFQPVRIGKFVVLPPWEKPLEDLIPIIINPKMAFGTGTHESTQLILELMEKEKIEGKKVLDVGCGSGILSIAAAKFNAEKIVGIDVDPLAIENAEENSELNNIGGISFRHTSAQKLGGDHFDVIFANIVKNVLIELSETLTKLLDIEGYLFLSGILEEDVNAILSAYYKLDFELVSKSSKNEWKALILHRGKK